MLTQGHDSFVYESSPSRVLFGSGRRAGLAAEIERIGGRKPLFLSTPGRAAATEREIATLSVQDVTLFAGAMMHTPVEVTLSALRQVEAAGVDCLVAVGGGSTIGLGKALALRTGLPLGAIPTTYAGSEMTAIIGETRDGVKTTQTNSIVLPRFVIYDVDLTVGLPAATSVVSGFNAMAHAVEALYARNGNPIIALMAEAGIRAMATALPRIVVDPTDIEARGAAQYGAWLCGVCLGSVGMALHHKICHVLGGSFKLPHAETHTVILPHVLAYNSVMVPAAIESLCRALETTQPSLRLSELAKSLGAPTSLEALGMPRDQLDDAVAITMKNPYWNPHPLDSDRIRAMLERAWTGAPPVMVDADGCAANLLSQRGS